MRTGSWLLITVTVLAACGGEATDAVEPEPFEAISLLGDTLRPAPIEAAEFVAMEARLDSARSDLAADSSSAEAWIWVGRRTAYLGRYREAIEHYGEAMRRFPDDARFLRHRGHRYLSVRDLEAAIADLQQAARMIAGSADRVEPDGLPNARNIPTSTLHSNIWYHLGLAHYLRGDFESALDAYLEEAAIADNPDMLVATSWWRYLTLRRLGREAEAAAVLAPIDATLDIIENHSYHRLLLMAKGELTAEELLAPVGESGDPANAAVSYGVGAWRLLAGERESADSLFRALLERGPWPAFGVIAAEAELARGVD